MLFSINIIDAFFNLIFINFPSNFFKINENLTIDEICKKIGIKHFLDKLIEKVLITKNDYDTILENYEHMNLLEIYYKSKLHFGYNFSIKLDINLSILLYSLPKLLLSL